MVVRSLTGWFIKAILHVQFVLHKNLNFLFEEGRGKTRGWGGLHTKFFRGQSDSVLQKCKQEGPGLKRGNDQPEGQRVHVTATQAVATKDRTMRKIQTIDTSEADWSSVSSNKTTVTTSQEVSLFFFKIIFSAGFMACERIAFISVLHMFMICSWIIRWTFFIHSFFLSARTNDANELVWVSVTQVQSLCRTWTHHLISFNNELVRD